ncbi:hypothetical protein CBM2585_A130235 [Cupriavidus taiwanensis]|nr:hypothetical protein CBM2585_A130235 [Cupriavidus taiwanensis]
MDGSRRLGLQGLSPVLHGTQSL